MTHDLDVLVDRVLFESNRTCCICRDASRPVQIHHIDHNHSNNERRNLAVTCDTCHKLAHTKIPFSRNLTEDQVRLYDETWRAICAAKLLPERSPVEVDEYRQEVLLELSLVCHGWKNTYMALYSGHFAEEPAGRKFADAWDLLETGIHQDSEDEWKRYLPLIDTAIDLVIKNLQTVLSCYGGIVPLPLKILTIRTIRQLTTERAVYKLLGPHATSVQTRIQGVLRALAMLSRTAEAGTKISPTVPFRE